ncbi:MAG TPA: acyltransferase [Afipia sp.]|uniref:acyltransferase family protein n=1 Tax=unclassified Afipia TaxID=2642050 RepID=UPI00046753E3|nr:MULTISPECIES: acyltransferase family protein [unclassified Afipia]MAH68618.1 acyltransferase [Afipia sp.]OUX62201.1 MAG: acyltransferase [Afipia sp. TMED4]HAP11734.1 acyltransferase [Afipia sp.]HAP46794.1 acyltransferase [Afipia sp.]HAQ92898.1 acyltransferase [Afipia sp.]
MTAPRHFAHGVYRPDVDGLRCIAVLGVIFCHLKFSALPGGFVGVDVFFVISGYLISRNILNDLQDGRFSLLTFYDRRIRRIFPALFVTIAASFAVGLVLSSPEQLRVLAGDVVSSLFSIVNIRFWKGAHDYFAASSDERTLLHLWSLSVEEQFYLVWPALLLLLTRAKHSAFLFVAITTLAAASLIAAQLWLPRDTAAAFYLTPFRVFEFAFGTIVVLAERRGSPGPRQAIAMFAMGLVLIFASMIFYTAATPFPGLTAAIPAAGTALAIYGGRGSTQLRILGNPAAVWVGTISYSLYLCHWPVIVFGRHVIGDWMEVVWVKLVALAVMFGLATMLHRLVEVPFRSRAPEVRPFWKLLGACGVAIAVVAVPAHTAFRQDGWSWRFNEAQRAVMHKQAFAFAPCSEYLCVFGDTAGPLGVQIIGDSYAQQYVAALQPLLLKLGMRGESYAYGGCLMLDGIRLGHASTAARCAAERDATFEKVRSSAAPVLIAQAWRSYRNLAGEDGRPLPANTDNQYREAIAAALSRTIDKMGGPDRRILLIGGEVLTHCKKYETEIRRLSIAPPPDCAPPTLAEVRTQTAPWNETFRSIKALYPDKVTTLFPEDYLCPNVCEVMNGDLWLFRDTGHLTVMGSELLGARAEDTLVSFLLGKPATSVGGNLR